MSGCHASRNIAANLCYLHTVLLFHIVAAMAISLRIIMFKLSNVAIVIDIIIIVVRIGSVPVACCAQATMTTITITGITVSFSKCVQSYYHIYLHTVTPVYRYTHTHQHIDAFSRIRVLNIILARLPLLLQ